jgi:hypothetical protein
MNLIASHHRDKRCNNSANEIDIYLAVPIRELWNHLGEDLLEVTAASLCYVALKIVIALLEHSLEVHV